MLRYVSVTAFAAASLVASAEGATQVRPVPAEMLDGATLRVTDENFEIDTPTRDWQWMQAQLPQDGSSLYLCQNVSGGRFLLAVMSDQTLDETDGWFEKVLADSQASQARQGRHITNLKTEMSEVPTQGAHRWVADVEIPGTGQMGWHGYAVRGGRVYLFQYYGSDPELVSAFERWAKSFRTLRHVRRRLQGAVAAVGIVAGFTALVVGAAGGWFANKTLRRSAVNPGTMAAYLILGVVACEATFLWVRDLIPTVPEPGCRSPWSGRRQRSHPAPLRGGNLV